MEDGGELPLASQYNLECEEFEECVQGGVECVGKTRQLQLLERCSAREAVDKYQ